MSDSGTVAGVSRGLGGGWSVSGLTKAASRKLPGGASFLLEHRGQNFIASVSIRGVGTYS